MHQPHGWVMGYEVVCVCVCISCRVWSGWLSPSVLRDRASATTLEVFRRNGKEIDPVYLVRGVRLLKYLVGGRVGGWYSESDIGSRVCFSVSMNWRFITSEMGLGLRSRFFFYRHIRSCCQVPFGHGVVEPAVIYIFFHFLLNFFSLNSFVII